MPKPSVFDAQPVKLKANGKPANSGEYTSNPTVRSPVSPPTPGFIQRIRSALMGPDSQFSSTLDAGVGGDNRRKAVDKVVAEATK